ncbi:MAG: TROVE domain-containing protein [Cyanobacteria bacterium SZAS TMP-1]|nr:TROVE domain-containing protein [Cyanobacteria bacterium SZAS TMP-1]
MSKYNLHFFTRKSAQKQPVPGTVPNNAGGYSFEIDDWTALRRFLILGSEGGTYYVGEAKLTRENAMAVQRLLLSDPLKVVAEIVEISQAGRSAKNDACLFALAMAAALSGDSGRAAALNALPQVARTGTHLFTFAAYVESFRGWGRGLRTAVGKWYEAMPNEKLAVQLTKYRERNGWTHRDLLRLAHPKTEDAAKNALFGFAVKNSIEGVDDATVQAFYRLQNEKLEDEQVAQIVADARLSIEMVPTELRSAKVYEALTKQAGLEWLLRNLGNLAKHDVLTVANDDVVSLVRTRLTDTAAIHRARLHPLKILAALSVYRSGKGVRGSGTWTPLASIVDALDEAFYASFDNLAPTNKRLCLGLDVSGSMAGTKVNGVAGLSAREAAAAMALATAKVEDKATFVAFDTKDYHLSLSPKQRLDDVVDVLKRTGGGGTDCAIPIIWAADNKVPVDVFVVYTDSETWAGDIHPVPALDRYREKMNIDARLVTVAMAANRVSLSDCTDKRMLNVVGFDTATPEIISQFIGGTL